MQRKEGQETSSYWGVEWEIEGEGNVEIKYEINDSCCNDSELSVAQNTELSEHRLSVVY